MLQIVEILSLWLQALLVSKESWVEFVQSGYVSITEYFGIFIFKKILCGTDSVVMLTAFGNDYFRLY